ncbi:MAG: phospholipase [Boseongicola sp.]|nr:phospholipase [Boseongicola sp.]
MRVEHTLTGVLAVVLIAVSSASADILPLPGRETPVPQTTDGVPHVQIGIDPDPEISAELLDRVSRLPGVEIRPTVISLAGALGFWISEEIALARSDVIAGGREFAHLHPDGSLHASLPPDLAQAASEAGWAVAHPLAGQRPGWEGFVMIFTPANSEELDVVYDLVVHSYAFVTGSDASSF